MPNVADWDGGMSASCRPQVQLFTNVSSGWSHSVKQHHYANQLPLLRFQRPNFQDRSSAFHKFHVIKTGAAGYCPHQVNIQKSANS